MPYIFPQDTATRQLGQWGPWGGGPPAHYPQPAVRQAAMVRRPMSYPGRVSWQAFPQVFRNAAARAARMAPKRAMYSKPRMAGDYINQRFVIPTNSLGEPMVPPAAMGGSFVESEWRQPPYRNLGQGFLDQETIPGVPNKYALGGLLALLVLTGARKRRRR